MSEGQYPPEALEEEWTSENYLLQELGDYEKFLKAF